MFSRVQSFLDVHMAGLITGDLSVLVPCFAPVSLMAFGKNHTILRGRKDVLAFLQDYRTTCEDAGITAMAPKVVAVSLHRGIRFRAMVHTDCKVAGSPKPYLSKTEYGLVKVGGGAFQIEMMMCIKSSLDEIVKDAGALRVSA